MRIVVVQDYLRMGGTERQSLFLCGELLRCGHDVQLLLFRPGGPLWEDMQAIGIPFRVLQEIDTKICLLAPGLMETIESMRPDVLLCMGRTANCYSALMQHHLPTTKVVSTLRTGKLISPLHYLSLKRVSAVLVNSNWWRRRMLEKGFPPERISLIHNPLMLRTGSRNRPQWRDIVRKRTGATEQTCVFLDVASLRSGKRHIELLEAFRLFNETTKKDWQLWLVGNGKEGAACRRFVYENGLEKRVFLFGQQPHTGPYYAGADAAVSASREDSLPNFLIEAQAMGLPLVAVDCRGVKECCIPGKTGIIIRPGDTEGFARELERLVTDDALRSNAAKLAPQFAQENFGAEKQAALTVAFLEGLAADCPAGTESIPISRPERE